MSKNKADIKADINSRSNESVTAMEPMVLSDDCRDWQKLTDSALTLAQESAAFKHSMPSGLQKSLAKSMRYMNCYYSNLIEGHNTRPLDIERAMHEDYEQDERKRDLQIEARAHVKVQTWIDAGVLGAQAAKVENIRAIHRRFCCELPADMLIVEDSETQQKYPVVAGEFRSQDVKVGRHVPISYVAIPQFMQRFEEAYKDLPKLSAIISVAAAHHRLAWIHPFLDGNGRVTRLMSHAMFLSLLDSGALWSVSRGLARSESEYKYHLAACDAGRRNDLDGRGSLSQEALTAFTLFFLETCLDQVRFMSALTDIDKLQNRILLWAQEQIAVGDLPVQAIDILKAVLAYGELPRSEAVKIIGKTDRQARRVTSALLDFGVLASDSSRAPLRLNFPVALLDRWLPGLVGE